MKRSKMIVEDPGDVLRVVSDSDNIEAKLKNLTEPTYTHSDPTDPLVKTITNKTAASKDASEKFGSRSKNKGTDNRGDSDNDHLGVQN